MNGASETRLAFRLARAEDRASLMGLGHRADEIAHMLGNHASRILTVVACGDGGDILGSTTAEELTGSRGAWVNGYIRVRQDVRGLGIGGRLGSALDSYLGDACRVLFANVRTDNIASTRMFERMGFVPAALKAQIMGRGMESTQVAQSLGRWEPVRTRSSLVEVGKELGYPLAIDRVASPTRPFGAFPPFLRRPHYELRHILTRHPSIRVLVNDNGRCIAASFGSAAIFNASATSEELALVCLDLIGRAAPALSSVYHNSTLGWPEGIPAIPWVVHARSRSVASRREPESTN